MEVCEKPVSTEPPKDTNMEISSTKKKRDRILAETWKDLPSDARKIVIRAGIDPEEAERHLRIVLSVLRFRTHVEYHIKSDYEKRPRVKPKRHNTGPSLVHPDIMSTKDWDEEAAELLDTEFTRKDYKTYHQLGKGGYGKVYLSKFSADKQNVAVKRVPFESSKDKRKGFQEVRFLRFFQSHPNIVEFKRAHVIKNELWIVTEYLPGGTLMQAVGIHKFSELQISYIARYILKAIQALHQNQVAHRDLKSSNIILSTSGDVKLIDLGLCTDVSQGHVTHMVGSPFWMPPEMIRKEPHGLAVDIWSFAVCIMEIANGRLPNRKSSMLAMFKCATEGYPEPFESSKKWSPSFIDFMSMCLVHDPNRRASVNTLLTHPWLARRSRKSEMKTLFTNIFATLQLSTNT